MKKAFNFVSTIAFSFLIIIEALIMIVLLVTKIRGEKPSILGYNLYVVVSGSMVPQYNIGDVLLAKNYNDDELIEGETVISYIAQSGAKAGEIITHTYMGRDENNKIITKGVANTIEDDHFDEKYIISVIVYKTHVIGPIYKVLTTTAGFICLVLVPIIAVIIYEFINMAKIKFNESEENRDETVICENQNNSK